jgi:metal-sulfur cluster biosynthetic enzyme
MTAVISEATADRRQQVMVRLDRVADPELDEPVTDLGFIEAVDVDACGRVHVCFRLPTYWCAANFAFLMADDMRREIAELVWVREVHVQIGEHMYAQTINRGLRENLSFREAFGKEASGDLEEIRRTFAIKSFQRRQEALLQHLLNGGHRAADLLRLTVAQLAAWPGETATCTLIARYLERRSVAGPVEQSSLAFTDAAGAALAPERLGAYLRALRSVAVNIEFNGALCRGLLAARFGDTSPDGEPTLRDFVRRAAAEHGTADG